MKSEGQPLPPAAVAQWYELAIAVLEGVEDPQERQEWVRWGATRRAIGEMNQAPSKGQGARRMGDFDGGVRTSRHTRYKKRV
jgi:hypothetical protein